MQSATKYKRTNRPTICRLEASALLIASNRDAVERDGTRGLRLA